MRRTRLVAIEDDTVPQGLRSFLRDNRWEDSKKKKKSNGIFCTDSKSLPFFNKLCINHNPYLSIVGKIYIESIYFCISCLYTIIFYVMKSTKLINPVGWNYRIRRLWREVRQHHNECPRYDTKLYLMVTLQYWSSRKCGVPVHYHYSQVHSDLLESHLCVKQTYLICNTWNHLALLSNSNNSIWY